MIAYRFQHPWETLLAERDTRGACVGLLKIGFFWWGLATKNFVEEQRDPAQSRSAFTPRGPPRGLGRPPPRGL